MKTVKIALDIDDVLASFYQGMCEMYNQPEKHCDIWCPVANDWIVKMFPEVELEPRFWMNLPRVSSPEAINFEVAAYITSSPQKMLKVREQWLENNRFPKANIYHAKNKSLLMKKLGIDVLVDDKISTVKAVNKAGLLGIQFKPPYMSQEYNDSSKVITHLSQVQQVIENHFNEDCSKCDGDGVIVKQGAIFNCNKCK